MQDRRQVIWAHHSAAILLSGHRHLLAPAFLKMHIATLPVLCCGAASYKHQRDEICVQISIFCLELVFYLLKLQVNQWYNITE